MSQFLSSGKNRYRTPNLLYSNKLDRSILIPQLSQTREIKTGNDLLSENVDKRILLIDQYVHQLAQEKEVKRKYQLVLTVSLLIPH